MVTELAEITPSPLHPVPLATASLTTVLLLPRRPQDHPIRRRRLFYLAVEHPT
jgi:hypothetical protein